jgi:tripartite-type tricarboxylate transporter receptor subunit TctC
MMMFRRAVVATVSLLGLLAALPACAEGPAYPGKVIRVIAPAPPGGAYDFAARLVAEGLQRAWGQPVVVENRAGAGGTIGTEAAAKSAADGYTLLMGSTGPMSVSPSLIRQLRYDPIKDFVPVARLLKIPSYLVVHPSLPVHNVKEFLAYAKANQGKLSYASTGNGLSQHTNMELLKSMTGLFITPITYRGSGPALNDLLGNQVQVMVELGPQAIPLVKAGKLRVLATTSPSRTLAMPDVPTLSESGVPGFEAFTWFAVYVPAGTPREIVQRLHAQLGQIFKQPETVERLTGLGAEVAMSTPDELARFQASEAAKWAGVIKRAGIVPE